MVRCRNLRKGGCGADCNRVTCQRYMVASYTPIFRSILTSTIWLEKPHVKVVWWTMLLMCDRNGIVEGAVPGLANAAVVTVDECRHAIGVLLAPDPDSRTKEFDGRRIEEIDGGWRILNHQKHKDKLGLSSEAARVRVARHRARKAAKDVTLGNAGNSQSNDLDPRSLDQDQQTSEVAKSPDSSGKVPCPRDLSLTDDQRGALETSLIPGWAIDVITEGFVASAVADQTDRRQLVHWRKCLAKAISSQWHDSKRRPRKPEADPEKPKGGKPGQVWHPGGYWYFPPGVKPA